MMKILSTILFMLIIIQLFALVEIKEKPIPSPVKTSSILSGEPEDWLKAIIFIESGVNGKNAYNVYEPEAKGLLCIFPILVDDVNRILGWTKYTYDDRLSNKKSIEMFWIYQRHYNSEMNFEKMARIWCGGPDGYKQECTLSYYEMVKKRLIIMLFFEYIYPKITIH